MKKSKFRFPIYINHDDEDVLFNYRNSTPLQRLQWLEEMLKLLGPYLRKYKKVS